MALTTLKVRLFQDPVSLAAFVTSESTVKEIIDIYLDDSGAYNLLFSTALIPGANGIQAGSQSFSSSSTQTVSFSTAMPNTNYSLDLTPQVDTNDGSIPEVGWSNKTVNGFTIQTTSSYTGNIDWSATLY